MSPANDLNPAFRPRWYGVLALYIVALALGAGSAWLAVRSQLDSGGVSAGVWRTSTLAGSTDADIYTRAVIAVGALLALNRDETMYYVATTDSAGRALRSRCRYRISGPVPDARWWSVTAYAEDRFLFPNAERRYSLNGGSAALDARGLLIFESGPTAPAGNPPAAPWLPTPGDRGLSFTLRLYNPATGLAAAPASLAGPTIERLGRCE